MAVDPFLTAVFPFACVFVRTLGLLFTAPIFGAKFVPGQVKAGLSLALAFVLFGFVRTGDVPQSLSGWVGAAAGEIAFGLFMGMCASILLGAVELAGHIVDVEIGFSMANVVDPAFGGTSALMGTFKYLLISVLFMALDGHHLFLWGLAESFRLLPAGTAAIPASWFQVAVAGAGRMMLIAVVLSCPVWASLLITDIALGVLARSVPQLNIFVVGMPVKALVGMAVLSASVGFYGAFAEEISLSVSNILDSLLGVFAR